ncbi:FtsX-like permease family protein [Flavobacteriales bacterium]|nr:FtsX-like permease family protein [Flavobacteriales bacterium]
MNFPFYIAKRYLFSKKSYNVINIISGIAMVGIGVGAMAMVVVMSLFNGIQNLVEDLYSSFDPAIKITVVEGKTFDATTIPKSKILSIEGVEFYSETLEETVLLKHRDKQSVATMKGVEKDFLEMSGLDTLTVEGELKLNNGEMPLAVVGYGIKYHLGVYIEGNYAGIKVYAPNREKYSATNPEKAFTKKSILPGGVFTINPDFDDKYMLVPLSFAREILNYTSAVSAIELGLTQDANPDVVKEQIQSLIGEEYTVKTRYQLNEVVFKTNNTEKWITFLILIFILMIAMFNLVSAIAMIIMDKKKDIATLKALGANKSNISNIFLAEGMLISIIGGLAGMAFGYGICFIQDTFGIVKLEGIVVDQYPVLMKWSDFGMILSTVILIGVLASWFPVKIVVKKYMR